jgi:hypothetical protein
VSAPPIDINGTDEQLTDSGGVFHQVEAWKGLPAYNELAAHLMLCSTSGVISLLSSNSDVNDGTAVPAAYDDGCKHISSSKFTVSRAVLVQVLYGWRRGKEGGAAVLARPSTYHLILYELIRELRRFFQ